MIFSPDISTVTSLYKSHAIEEMSKIYSTQLQTWLFCALKRNYTGQRNVCPVDTSDEIVTKKQFKSIYHQYSAPMNYDTVFSVHCIFNRFFAIASSTAFSCIRSSSRRDDVLFRFKPPAEVSDGCIKAGLDSGWSGRGRDALTGERAVAMATSAAAACWFGRALLRTGDVAVASFCVLSNFGIGILTGSFSSVNATFIHCEYSTILSRILQTNRQIVRCILILYDVYSRQP